MSYNSVMMIAFMVTIILVLAIMAAILIYMLRHMKKLENEIQQLNCRVSCCEENMIGVKADGVMLHGKVDKLQKRVDANEDTIIRLVRDKLKNESGINERNIQEGAQRYDICLNSVTGVDCCGRSGHRYSV
ncbi:MULTISPECIES: hypothetical protein [Ehrlichia]|uniref:Uncharacterized protein n=1 Tax=Ehrlichia cf. muris str. EmCRT TaxID=1359167 RepID=A0A0F3NBZ7_9RICK|nr:MULTISPECIES: hypothetical protein [Ehrlichia]KJV65588.1 hypothetical protein EMUCRT_0533 [Ehrlichia cf. muris str. EmCRT]OUC04460.1 hypothetical protein DB91_02730 [Ehrlichia sp. Wisconsin_h]